MYICVPPIKAFQINTLLYFPQSPLCNAKDRCPKQQMQEMMQKCNRGKGLQQIWHPTKMRSCQLAELLKQFMYSLFKDQLVGVRKTFFCCPEQL